MEMVCQHGFEDNNLRADGCRAKGRGPVARLRTDANLLI